MKLDVLPSGDMQDAVGVFVREIGQATELAGGKPAKRQFGANHLLAILPLAVDPLLQAKALEVVYRHLAPVEPFHFRGKVFNLLFHFRGYIQRFDIHYKTFFSIVRVEYNRHYL
jgi:hypothetical protein